MARAAVIVILVCASAVWAFAQTPSSANRSKSFGPDACGPADPAYIRSANETGGIPLFLQRSEAAKAFHLVRETTRNNAALVFWATGALTGTEIIDIPVDSATKRITFSFSVDTKGSKLILRGPSGAVLGEGSPATETTELNCGRIVTVSSPQPGKWRAELAGTGTFWLVAEAQSDIYFVSAEFVNEGGRPGHEGLFRIPGQPLAGTPATLRVSLSAAPTKTVRFQLVTERGETIQTLRLRPVNTDRELLEFVGNIEIPRVPFRVAVAGTVMGGEQYQRFFARLFRAELVEVSPRAEFDELPPGTTKHAVFVVRNAGPAGVFKISATDARQFVSGAEPKELSLGAGESGLVRVDVTVPPGTTDGIGDDVVVIATSNGQPSTSNYSVVHFSVSSAAGQTQR